MFIQNLCTDFYHRLVGKRILIIVNYDIDAICASKILQSLLKHDQILYSVIPILGLSGLRRAYTEHRSDVKFVLMINCGGCVDLVGLLHPEEDVTFFICDSHRPLDVCNIYSDHQVCIFGDPNKEENLPVFDSIFCESDSEDEADNYILHSSSGDLGIENIDDDSNPIVKKLSRLEKHERDILKQRRHRDWSENRDRIMFEYTQFSFYNRSSALTIFELAWKLSKDSMDLLWLAIVGITEQLILGKIESTVYTLEIENIQSHVTRLSAKTNDKSNTGASKINFENDLHLVLYRHWSVLESMRYSIYSACKLKLWTLKGEKTLNELLVEMGLPLIQARQTFSSMDLVLRQEFYTMIEKLADKYDLSDIIYGSFTLSYGYRNRYSAADYVYALLAILESVGKNKTPEDCFLQALDGLSRSRKDILKSGINNAKLLLSAIFKQVQSSLESNQIHSTGTFYYYILNEENKFFSYPYGLKLLAKFILNSYVAMSRNRQAAEFPLIASCPVDSEYGLCLLIGIPPMRGGNIKNFFGKAFEQAADRSNATILQDFFESSLIQIKQSDLTRFLDALTVILA